MAHPCLYIGTVFHKRFAPKIHELRYRVFTLFADLDDLADISKNCVFFSFNKFNLVSFYEKDFGDPKAPEKTALKDRVLNLLEQNGVNFAEVKSVKILTYPRVLGFVFNPLTVFYCYGEDGEHIAVVYEVRNTFSERHNYIFSVPEGGNFEDAHEAKKCFHVSPFFDKQGKYVFKLKDPDEKVSVLIKYECESSLRLTASFSGNRVPVSDKELLKNTMKMPFMTVKVVLGILFEAILLKLKGIKVFSRSDDHIYQSSFANTGSIKSTKKINKDMQ